MATRLKQFRHVSADQAICLAEVHMRAREVVVRHDDFARIDKLRGPGATKIGRDDQRGEAFAKTRGKIERSWRAMTQELHAVQGVMQIAEQLIDLCPDPRGAA